MAQETKATMAGSEISNASWLSLRILIQTPASPSLNKVKLQILGEEFSIFVSLLSLSITSRYLFNLLINYSLHKQRVIHVKHIAP